MARSLIDQILKLFYWIVSSVTSRICSYFHCDVTIKALKTLAQSITYDVTTEKFAKLLVVRSHLRKIKVFIF